MQLIERLYRMVVLTVGRGRVKAVDDSGNVQLLQAKLGDLETRDKLPRLAEYGFASRPPIDSDAVAVFAAGDRSNGVVVATGHQPSRPKDLEDGEAMIYDKSGRWVKIGKDEIEIEAGGKPVKVKNASEVEIECTVLKVTGDIVDHSGSNGVTLKELRDAYNAHHHTGVQTGGGTTGPTDNPAT